jgi:hypothetical protein
MKIGVRTKNVVISVKKKIQNFLPFSKYLLRGGSIYASMCQIDFPKQLERQRDEVMEE